MKSSHSSVWLRWSHQTHSTPPPHSVGATADWPQSESWWQRTQTLNEGVLCLMSPRFVTEGCVPNFLVLYYSYWKKFYLFFCSEFIIIKLNCIIHKPLVTFYLLRTRRCPRPKALAKELVVREAVPARGELVRAREEQVRLRVVSSLCRLCILLAILGAEGGESKTKKGGNAVKVRGTADSAGHVMQTAGETYTVWEALQSDGSNGSTERRSAV